MRADNINDSQASERSDSFDSDVVYNKLLAFFSKSSPYRNFKELNHILEGLKDLPRSKVIRLFASISQSFSLSNESISQPSSSKRSSILPKSYIKNIFKLSAAWIFCTNTSQINKYPNLTNPRLLVWCFTGLFSNVNIALGYLLYLLRKSSKGVNSINLYYNSLYNEYSSLEDLIDMIPKTRNRSACDRIFCCLISLYANIFKRYNQFFYKTPLDEYIISKVHIHLNERIKEASCNCWKRLILPILLIYLSSGEELEKCITKFDVTLDNPPYLKDVAAPPTDPPQEPFSLNEIKRIIRFNKDWRLLLREGEPIKGPINDITLARNTVFALVNQDIFEKDELLACCTWALSVTSGNVVTKVTGKKILVHLLDMNTASSELSMDMELYNFLISLLHYVNKKLDQLVISSLTTSFLAFLFHALSNYWEIIEESDQSIVGRVLLYFIPSINSKGEYVYSKHQSILLYIEILVKAGLKIALPEHIIRCSRCFIKVRPTDLSENVPNAQELYQSIAYNLYIYSNGLFYQSNPSLKASTSYLVRWAALLSRFSDFSLYQMRLMTAIISDILPLILRKKASTLDSLISLINVIFAAFTSNPALDSMKNKRGRRAEPSMLLDEIVRFLKITFIICYSTLLQYHSKPNADLARCTMCTIRRFVSGLLKLLPKERRQMQIFVQLKEILEAKEPLENTEDIDKQANERLYKGADPPLEKRRKYNYHLSPSDGFIDFETDKHLGMLLIRDESVRRELTQAGEIEIRPEWKYLIKGLLE